MHVATDTTTASDIPQGIKSQLKDMFVSLNSEHRYLPTDKQPLYTESPLFSPFLTYQLCADQHKYGCEFLNFIGISASKTALYKL